MYPDRAMTSREESSHAWSRVRQLLADALEQPLAAREAWLDAACGGDAALRTRLDALLEADASAERDAFLQTPALSVGIADAVASSLARESLGLVAGRRIGPYEIIREIGHGGMGTVYLGARADRAFEKQVAVKVVRVAAGDVAATARFDDERRIVATLDHPHIARLLDGGVTPDGLSFLVLEYVDGLPIDDYCRHHQLSLARRLALFGDVCTAVHYAHQRLVIHRDIKPRNILVTADGTPKLLDFGIAKLLGDGADGRTATGLRAFTLESASPEQIRGDPMTVTSDIYSLGVLGYVLVTGRHPSGDGASTPTELARAICDDPPLRPTASARTGSGLAVSLELEWVLLKALRKEPDRRYSSVEQLAEDLRRLQDGRPVRAAPDSRRYRARKFVGRHRTAVAASLVVCLSLATGLATTRWQAQRADRRFNDVRQLAHTFMFDVHDAVEKLPGSTSARRLLVSNALTYLDRLASDAEGDRSLQRELATSYEKMADVLGRPRSPNLGDLTGAVRAYRKAQALRERLLVVDAGNLQLRRDLAATSSKMALALANVGESAAGLEEARKATRLEVALQASEASPGATLRLAGAYAEEGFLLVFNRRAVDGIDRLRQALALLEPLQGSGESAERLLGVTYSRLGEALCSGAPDHGFTANPRECLEMYRRSNEIDERLAAADPADRKLQRSVFVGTVQVADALVSLGERPSAVAYYERACEVGARLASSDSADLQAQSDAALACGQLGSSLARTGRAAEGLRWMTPASETLTRLARTDPGDLGTRARVAVIDEGMGMAHAALGASARLKAERTNHWREAVRRFRNSRAFWVEMRDIGSAVAAEELAAPDRLAREIDRCETALAALR